MNFAGIDSFFYYFGFFAAVRTRARSVIVFLHHFLDKLSFPLFQPLSVHLEDMFHCISFFLCSFVCFFEKNSPPAFNGRAALND